VPTSATTAAGIEAGTSTAAESVTTVERDSCERLPRAHHSSSPPEVEVDRILELQSPALTTRHIYSSVGPLPARVDAVSQGVDGRRVSDSM